MSNLKGDDNGNVLQSFAPDRAEDVVAATPWVPTKGDVAFAVPTSCTYTINGAGSSMTLQPGAIRALREEYTYTFDTTMTIEVM